MKSTIFWILIISLLAATSCRKSSPPSYPGGSWTFKGVTYYTTTCTDSVGDLSAANITISNYSTPTLSSFDCIYQGSAPLTAGTYTVISPAAPGTLRQIAIILNTSGGTYYSTSRNDSNQTVHITVTGGKVTATGTGIELVNYYTPSDSAAISFSITQLQ